MYEYVPEELKVIQWVCWKAVEDEGRFGKIKKIPVDAVTRKQAKSNVSGTWTNFETAVKVSQNYSGIGFMFANVFFGVDIDDEEDAVADFKNGEKNNIIAEFVYTLQSYAEYSVSGTGIHIICKGRLPRSCRRKNNIEMY